MESDVITQLFQVADDMRRYEYRVPVVPVEIVENIPYLVAYNRVEALVASSSIKSLA